MFRFAIIAVICVAALFCLSGKTDAQEFCPNCGRVKASVSHYQPSRIRSFRARGFRNRVLRQQGRQTALEIYSQTGRNPRAKDRALILEAITPNTLNFSIFSWVR